MDASTMDSAPATPPSSVSCRDATTPLVVNPTDDAGPPQFPNADEDTTPAVRNACAALERATAARIAGMRRRDRRFAVDEEHADLGRCHPAGRGAWFLDIAEWELLEFTSCDPSNRADRQWTYAVRYRLGYIAPDGRMIRQQNDVRDVYRRECDRKWEHVELTFDYDGDGVAEILLSTARAGTARTEFSAELLTVRGGAIETYRPAGEAISTGANVTDVDGDRRPDLIVAGPYVGECEGFEFQPRYFSGVSLVLHSLPDGHFDGRDAVSRAWVLRQCESRTLSPPLSSECSGLTMDIGCARFFGTSATGVRATLRAAAQGSAASDLVVGDDSDPFVTLAQAEPPFVVPRCATNDAGQ